MIIKRIFKEIAHYSVDCYIDHKIDNVHSDAYRKTGKELSRAKRNGKHVNGSTLYKKNRNTELKIINRRRDSAKRIIKSF